MCVLVDAFHGLRNRHGLRVIVPLVLGIMHSVTLGSVQRNG